MGRVRGHASGRFEGAAVQDPTGSKSFESSVHVSFHGRFAVTSRPRGEVFLPFQVTKYGHRIPGLKQSWSKSGRPPARFPNPSSSVAVAHTEHLRDRGGETPSLHLPSHPVHVPSVEDRGGDGRASDVARHEPHAPAPRIRGPH